ncbi:MAG: TIGR01244 family sulfur transferase [Pseudomonadota bacterium]
MQEGVRFFKLTETVASSPQIHAEDMAEIAAQGYKVVVNNRPDGEVPDQPTAESLREAAEAAGLEYHFYPVNAFNYPGDGLEEMKRLFADAERPVLAFCRSGTRCANLWISAQEDDNDRELARDRAQRLGFDTSMSLT